MRINVYTEELLTNADRSEAPLAQVVYKEYVSSRTGEKMRNYGLRIFLKSHPDLHYIPGRDDDRSAITFWCGPKEKTIFEYLETIRQVAYASTLDIWREKTEEQQKAATAALPVKE